MMEADSEYQESTSITFEWTLRDLKNLFDSTKGDAKSKVTKSAKFGEGRWQVLFYANAGTVKDGGAESGFVSLYLSCEPTSEEKEAALADNGRWVRQGVYKFSFELRNVGKTAVYNLKEATNHSFSYKTANWGWAQFAKRDSVYYQVNATKNQDAFMIICTITSSLSPPQPTLVSPYQPVPKTLLETVGALLDNPLYSDVQFIIPQRGRDLKYAKKIWASRLMLRRAEYFDEMFGSGFAEGSHNGMTLTPKPTNQSLASSGEESGSIMDAFEDSDDEDEQQKTTQSPSDEYFPDMSDTEDATTPTAETNCEDGELVNYAQDTDDLRPQHAQTDRDQSSEAVCNSFKRFPLQESKQSSMSIVVRDVAYSTYFAILYYIYTDKIVFAPLSSSFISAPARLLLSPSLSLPSTPSENQGQVSGPRRSTPQETASSRAEWISDWMQNNPGRPAPCSAKAVYRVADRLDLRELKERAAQHIFKSLTIENIAYEVFSPFAAAFEEIRKVEIRFFLTHWQDIRTSEAMKNVWQQIRNGRHPGFEEVWPLIAQSLEFKPSTPPAKILQKTTDGAQQGSG